MLVRAVRGAITVEQNTKEEILTSTEELLREIVKRNNLDNDNIISAVFTMTNDLNAAFPAVAARQLGWTDISLMCTNEINVPGSLQKCIRVLIHFNTDKSNKDIKHVYLREAEKLRPDLCKK